MQERYIERILKARVYDVAIESPLEDAPRLSRRLGNRVLFKREDLQPVFSFKLRGAYNKIAHLSETVAKRGVICASAGNHAQGVALAARRRRIPAVIVMPPGKKLAISSATKVETRPMPPSTAGAYLRAMFTMNGVRMLCARANTPIAMRKPETESRKPGRMSDAINRASAAVPR